MLDYAALQALAAVLREGSFERAAQRLHVTPSAVSQRIKQLEERAGQVLVQRGSPCTGTEAGRHLCLHLEQVAYHHANVARLSRRIAAASSGLTIASSGRACSSASSSGVSFLGSGVVTGVLHLQVPTEAECRRGTGPAVRRRDGLLSSSCWAGLGCSCHRKHF